MSSCPLAAGFVFIDKIRLNKVQIDYIFTPTVAAAGLTGGILFFGMAFAIGI